MDSENKITVYDGNCNLCMRVVTRFVKWKWLDESKTKPYEELSAEQQSQIDIEQFRSEMAVIDSSGGPTLYGVEGFLCAVGKRFPFLHSIKKDGFLFPLVQFIYRLVAWNRYIIMRPVSTVKCDCEPPLNRFYRLSLVAACAIIAMLISALVGITLCIGMFGFNIDFHTILFIAKFSIGVAVSGWVLQLLIAAFVMKEENFYDYFGNIGVIALAGSMILLPGIFCFWLHWMTLFMVINACVFVSFMLMLRMHYLRIKFMGLSQWWTISWALFLISSILIYWMWKTNWIL